MLSISSWSRRTGAILVAAGIAGSLALWYFANRLPPIPQRPLRIGFEQLPPVAIRTSGGFEGLAVETLTEAARRARIRLQWVETGTSSDEGFQKGLVDLWPVMADLPERRKRLHLTHPWMRGGHALLVRADSAIPHAGFTGSIAVYKMPLHVRLLQKEFPAAEVVQFPDNAAVLKEVCLGRAVAGFMEWRTALNTLHDKPAECSTLPLRAQTLPDLTVELSVASTFEAAGAAEKLRREIGTMFRDGTMAVTVAKYSSYGLDDTWATYDLMQAAERARWTAGGISGLTIALAVVFWRVVSSRQRGRAEAVLRESEERFRAIFQQAAVGFAQVNLTGEILLVNDRYCELLGYPREELLGARLLNKTHPDDLEMILANRRRLLAGEAPSYNMDMRFVRKDGVVVWAGLFVSLVRDRNGQGKYFISVVEDNTERKRAEEALRESEARFRNMADTAPVMIWVTGPDKLCTFFNKRWLDFTGRTLEQEVGNGWVEGVHPEDVESCTATYSSAFDTCRSFQIESRARRADGEYRSLLCTGVPRFTDSGTFAGFVGCSIDITDLKRSQEQVLATQKLESLGVLAGGIAHDFNNLLGGILTSSELVLEDVAAGSPAHEWAGNIKAVAVRAAEIVRQLMAYSGNDDAVFESVDVSRLVGEMLQLLKVSISKHALLKVDLPENLPAVRANPAQIRQVVMNLITNASEALGEYVGVITITTARVRSGQDSRANGAGSLAEDDFIRLEVSDTGSGMTPEVQARMFDPFFTTKFAGRGLGLAAIQGIIRRHGGTIHVVSKPGDGSRFEILLPSTGEPAWRAVTAAGSSGQVVGTCLLVEDEETLRLAISKMLGKRGFSVIEAADGRAAVNLFRDRESEIDVVLLDVTLPSLSGREVLDAVRRIRPDVKVILTSAYSKDAALTVIGGQRAWAYIQKPYQFSNLSALLRDACVDKSR